MTTHCRICDRELTDAMSMRREIGPICWAKLISRIEEEQMTREEGMQYIETDYDGVVCARRTVTVRRPGELPFDLSVVATNIPWRTVMHSPDGYEWGYAGSGPADFALNILLHYGVSPARADELHQSFKAAFVAGLPARGGHIAGGDIRQWIAHHNTHGRTA